jgi:predicted  nucleic acid-binding Zn-ribbon protein
MSQALTLYRLQQIDHQLDRDRARLQSIQKILEDDADLSQAVRQAKEAEAEQKTKELALKKAETEVNDLRIKIEQTEASLYGGSVRNPKELQDLQNDAASMKHYLVTLEDRLLEAMLAAEETQQANDRLQQALAGIRSGREAQTRSLIEEQASLNKNLQKLNTERLAITDTLAPELASLYEELRHQRRGVAVTDVHENACGACGTTLPPAQVQAARSPSQLSRCPSCGRILYAS